MLTIEEFLEQMKEILDNEEISMDTVLSQLDEWDSLSVISYVSLASSIAKKRLSAKEVRACTTIKDLYALLN